MLERLAVRLHLVLGDLVALELNGEGGPLRKVGERLCGIRVFVAFSELSSKGKKVASDVNRERLRGIKGDESVMKIMQSRVV